MKPNPKEDFQYNSCVSRGICSINPRITALQTVIILYLRFFARFLSHIKTTFEVRQFILNTLVISLYNPDFNEDSFLFALKKIKEILPEIMDKNFEENTFFSKDVEKNNAENLFKETDKILDSIKFGERILSSNLKKIPSSIRNLYNIMLYIAKNLSINLLELQKYDKDNLEAYNIIIKILNNIEPNEFDKENLKSIIYQASKIDYEIIYQIRNVQEENYGKQTKTTISFSTFPHKAVLVVGSNLSELDIILKALEEEDIDIYTHDDMILAHTFPYFKSFKNLKGQYGHGIENCLIDFATFPGPIILTQNSLHNIENFYRGRLFTTDYTTSPKGIIKIKDNDFTEVIVSAKEAKGFKKGKVCETIEIGYDYEETIQNINKKMTSINPEQIFVIAHDDYSSEQENYFNNLIKIAPKNILIISFSYNSLKENLIHINSCNDYLSWVKIITFIQDYDIPIKLFIPKCTPNSFSQIIHLAKTENLKIYLGNCTPIILNPAIIKTLCKEFSINRILNTKKDIQELIEDK